MCFWRLFMSERFFLSRQIRWLCCLGSKFRVDGFVVVLLSCSKAVLNIMKFQLLTLQSQSWKKSSWQCAMSLVFIFTYSFKLIFFPVLTIFSSHSLPLYILLYDKSTVKINMTWHNCLKSHEKDRKALCRWREMKNCFLKIIIFFNIFVLIKM